MGSAAARALALALLALPAAAQVDYHEDGHPWKQRASQGPDAEAPGWFYNLGPTGLRVELLPDEPCALLVRHVLAGSPAEGEVRVGDRILGIGGAAFATPHQDGYGMEVFGARGPIADFAAGLDAALAAPAKAGKRRLELDLEREGEPVAVRVPLGRDHGPLAATFPVECEASADARSLLLDHLVAEQREDGSWGGEVQDTFAPLALLTSSKRDHRRAAERSARYHARTTKAVDDSWLINWRYMAAGIVLAEYHLVTKERWVLEELEEVRDFLLGSQYTHIDQLNPAAFESHPGAVPRKDHEHLGGWGHNPGFEGYGPIAMLTGQGALVLGLMSRCGLEVPRERLEAAYAFLERGTGANGYVWYGDEAASDEDWADPGRTGAAGLALLLSPVAGDSGESGHRARGLAHGTQIGRNPESFPDTHGSPLMGMGYAALAAALRDRVAGGEEAVPGATPGAFRSLLDANRWWFLLARCPDGTYAYQPNRDNAGYGPDSRLTASAVVALILSIPEGGLAILGD